MYVALGCGLPVILFYIGYYKKLYENREVEICPLAMESIRFMVAIFLLLLLFAGSLYLCEYYHIGHAVPFVISILISVGFWGACRYFNIKDPSHINVQENR